MVARQYCQSFIDIRLVSTPGSMGVIGYFCLENASYYVIYERDDMDSRDPRLAALITELTPPSVTGMATAILKPNDL